MTLKLEGDLDILKMYLYTENEVARLMQKNTKIALKVKGHQLPITSSVSYGTSSYQVTLISDQEFSRFLADRHTDAAQNNTCSQHAHR